MSTESQVKVDEAKEAIDRVHSDTSVSQADTIESLNDIIGHAETLRDAVQQDLDRASDGD